MILIGEPYWRQVPATEEIAQACGVSSVADFLTLPELVGSFDKPGYDFAQEVRAELTVAPKRHVTYTMEYLAGECLR